MSEAYTESGKTYAVLPEGSIPCAGCVFDGSFDCAHRPCSPDERRDRRGVIFKAVGAEKFIPIVPARAGLKVYVIGSLRNPEIPSVAAKLREAGLDVFDDWFAAGKDADDWWRTYEQARGRSYEEALKGEAAKNVYAFDKRNLDASDAVVLVMPAGKSAHLELGYCAGKGKRTAILLEPEYERWDVMLQFADLVTSDIETLKRWLVVNGDPYTTGPRPSAPLSEPAMSDAIAAGDGTLHGAVDYWHARALAAEAKVPSEADQDAHATNQVLANNYLHLTCAPPAAPLSERVTVDDLAFLARVIDAGRNVTDDEQRAARALVLAMRVSAPSPAIPTTAEGVTKLKVVGVVHHDKLGHPVARLTSAFDAEGNGLMAGAPLYVDALSSPASSAEKIRDLTLALADAWPYVHQWCTIDSVRQKVSMTLFGHEVKSKGHGVPRAEPAPNSEMDVP